MLKKHRYNLLWILLLALATYRILHLIHVPHLERLAEISYQPITGHPYWRAFQNRLLGSALLAGLAKIPGISLLNAFKMYSAGFTALTLFSGYYIFNKLGSNPNRSLLYTSLLSFLIIILQDHKLMFAWDYIDIILFLFFFYGIFRQKGIIYFILLFLVGIANRESALFIPLWLIIESIPIHKFSLKKINGRKMAVGGFTLAAGVVYTWWIRNLLFIKSSKDFVGNDRAHAEIGNHWNLTRNLQDFVENMIYLRLDVIGTIFMLLIVVFLIKYRRKFTPTEIKSAFLIGVMLLSIWLFGLISETRVYMMVIPAFLLLFHQVRTRHAGHGSPFFI